MKKHCLDDEYLKEFKSDVVSCHVNSDGLFDVLLDKSYFYPESGGQTGDHGFIGNAKVLDVKLKDDGIVHITDREVGGKGIACKIDWKRRFDHMQQHTGQHIFSGIIDKYFHLKTLSFHMGEEDSSIETDSEFIDKKTIQNIEEYVNDVIMRDVEVEKYFTEKDVEGVRKKVDIKGAKRVVKINGVDLSYCGGTHVNRTGEIGLFKITGIDKVRKNIRLHYKCGYRALNDYRKRFFVVDLLKKMLTRDEDNIIEGIEFIIKEWKGQKKLLKRYREKELDEFVGKIDEDIYITALNGFSDEEIRYIQLKLINGGIKSLILNLDTNRLFLSVSKEENETFKKILERIKEEYGIKGGGNRGRFQLMLNDRGKEIYTRIGSFLK